MNSLQDLYRRFKPLVAAAAVLAALSGCAMAPTYERPAAPIAQQWSVDGQAAAASDAGPSAATLEWRDFVTDPSLRGLIETALANNRDLRKTLLNVEAARAMYRVQRADRLPTIGAQASGTRQHNPADLNPSGRAGVQSEWRAGLGVTAFELDLFGRVRSLSEAALEEYLATESGARSARISLIAEVIDAYLARESARERGLHTERTLASREQSLQLIERRRAEGIGSALDLEQAKGLTEQARADLARMEREFRQSTNALTLLAGVSDMSPYLAPHDGATPMLVQQLAAGTPSEMLANRPDILAAEHRLKARNADIGAARAAFFPRISLTGMFGSASSDLSDLFRAASAPGPSRRRSRCRSSTPAAIWRIWTGQAARTWRWPSTNSPSRPRSAKSWTRWRPPTRCAGRKTRSARRPPAARRRWPCPRRAIAAAWTTICATWTRSAATSPTRSR